MSAKTAKTPPPEAYHEAGHAVVGRRCGRRVVSIRLGRRLEGGRVDFAAADEPDDTWILRSVAIGLAGYLAQRRAASGDRAWAVRGAAGDMRQIGDVLAEAEALGMRRTNVLLFGARLARGILTSHWGEVERVARLLRVGRTVAGDAIFGVVRS